MGQRLRGGLTARVEPIEAYTDTTGRGQHKPLSKEPSKDLEIITLKKAILEDLRLQVILLAALHALNCRIIMSIVFR
eukprot:scaffold359235_cov23-Prasinocladus_malaysianus.AAC.1